MPKIKGLKFGDIVVNHWAADTNPQRIGIFVRYRGQYRKNVVELTDMKGTFWCVIHDKESKFEKKGSVIHSWSEPVKRKIRNQPSRENQRYVPRKDGGKNCPNCGSLDNCNPEDDYRAVEDGDDCTEWTPKDD
jgi:hypothetical protein